MRLSRSPTYKYTGNAGACTRRPTASEVVYVNDKARPVLTEHARDVVFVIVVFRRRIEEFLKVPNAIGVRLVEELWVFDTIHGDWRRRGEERGAQAARIARSKVDRTRKVTIDVTNVTQ